MITDDELLSLSQSGFIPGPGESEENFSHRVSSTRQAFLKLGVAGIPESHWEWVGEKLRKLFGFTPDSLPAFYSNRSLAPWQGAAAWVERGQIIAIQLRNAFKKGSFLGMYKRSEILSHEAVHAARSAFPRDPWDEFFAYMVSEKAWRRALGPIIQRPWEVWPFLIFCVLGALQAIFFLGAAAWIGAGFFRLIRAHLTLSKASKELQKQMSGGDARALLLRLTGEEIQSLSEGKEIKTSEDLRGRLITIYREKVDDRKSRC